MKNQAILQKFVSKFIWSSRSLENPNESVNTQNVLSHFGLTESEAGVSVNTKSALTLSAVYRAIRIKADTMASLPIHVIEKTGNGKQVSVDHDLNYLISKEPNNIMTSFTWREVMQGNMELYGNCYSEVIRNGSAAPIAINYHHFSHVTPKKNGNRIVYEIWDDLKYKHTSKKPRVVKSQNMIHIPGFGFNGLVGMAPIELAANSLGESLAKDSFSSRFFKNNAIPSLVLTGQNITKDQMDTSKKEWQKNHGGANQNGTAVLFGGWDVKQLNIPPDQAQFLESRKFSVIDAARWFGVQPHLLFDLDGAIKANIEQQGIEYVTYTIMGIVRRWEQELDRKLFSEKEKKSGKYRVKFNLNGLLRADAKTRAEYYRTLSNIGVLSINEVRSLEDFNDVNGGDNRFIQQNMMPVNMAEEVLKGKMKPQKTKAND